MKIKLYSDGHLKTAQKIFPEKSSDVLWLQKMWTNEEINLCKYVELAEDFENSPNLEYWEKKILDGERIAAYSDDILRWYEGWIGSRKLNILSVGCGHGIKEIALALKRKCKLIVGVDMAPYIKTLDKVVSKAFPGMIRFLKGDCLNLTFDNNTFDLILSHAVIYCIPDASLRTYFSEMLRVLKPGGTCLVSTVANLSPQQKFYHMFKAKKTPDGWKQTGWLRDKKHIMKFVPSNAKIETVLNLKHLRPFKGQGFSEAWGNVLKWFSENISPITNTAVAFEIVKPPTLKGDSPACQPDPAAR